MDVVNLFKKNRYSFLIGNVLEAGESLGIKKVRRNKVNNVNTNLRFNMVTVITYLVGIVFWFNYLIYKLYMVQNIGKNQIQD